MQCIILMLCMTKTMYSQIEKLIQCIFNRISKKISLVSMKNEYLPWTHDKTGFHIHLIFEPPAQ